MTLSEAAAALDSVHYALASAVAAMAAAWWRHVQSLAASRDKEVAARVEATKALDELTDEVTEMRQAMVKMAERSPWWERQRRRDCGETLEHPVGGPSC